MSDLISRQEAIDGINNICPVDTEYDCTLLDRVDVRCVLSDLPSAQPETPPYVAEIESEYKKWAGMPHINKPLAKALYEVWKKHDREDVSRNGDLISRKEAIDALSMMQGIVAENGVRKGISMAWQQIADLPPAQPEQKKGRWEYETMRHLITGEMRTVRICSECGGGWFRYDLSDGVEDAEPNFCPNCGADMRGEEDEQI